MWRRWNIEEEEEEEEEEERGWMEGLSLSSRL
jgi:hypothetical protein